MSGVDPIEAVAGDLWRGLPASPLIKQQKLTGWGDLVDADAQEAGIERRWFALAAVRPAAASESPDARTDEVAALVVAAYHLVVQWYTEEFDSIIGCCALRGVDPRHPGTLRARLFPSYVYAEDDDPIQALLRDVRQQRSAARAVDVDASGVAFPAATRAPVFCYVEHRCPATPVDAGAGTPSTLELDRVVVSATLGEGRAAIAVSMPAAIGGAIRLEDFHRHYERALRALFEGEYTRVGDVKAQFGERADVPLVRLEAMQRRVISMWALVLNVPEAALTETSNYFEHGGTSLNAFKLMNRVRLEFGRDVSVWEIIENPTVEGFARVLLRD